MTDDELREWCNTNFWDLYADDPYELEQVTVGVRRLLSEKAALEERLEAVKPWLSHDYSCDTENFGKPCTCGLDAALAAGRKP